MKRGDYMTNRIVKSFNKYIDMLGLSTSLYDWCDKENNVSQHIGYMFNRTQSMFRWNGLPESIPQRILELYLQCNGNVCFYEYKNTLYVFTGGLGGEYDVYYMPTLYTISNPALKISKSLRIDEECVVMSNDSMYMGLLPLNTKYATIAVESELSLQMALINTRLSSLISAPDDRTRDAAEQFLDDIKDGKLGVIAENAFLDGIKTQPYSNGTYSDSLTNIIETIQYQKASWYNEIGLNANYNMKRESLNTSESQMNNDALLPLVDDMLNCRKIGAEKVNKMYGTNISVELNSSWKDNEEEIKIEHGESINETKTEMPESGI
jgi:hypothetical protein